MNSNLTDVPVIDVQVIGIPVIDVPVTGIQVTDVPVKDVSVIEEVMQLVIEEDITDITEEYVALKYVARKYAVGE